MVRSLGTSEGHEGKRDQGKEPNFQHKISFALADFACGGSTPHISASLRFDTIQALVRQFGQTVEHLSRLRRLQEKVE
jgi:hypothetical protein